MRSVVVVAVGIMCFTKHTDLANDKLLYTEPNSGWIFLTPLSSTRFARKSRSATGRMLGQVSLLRVNSEPNLGASWDAQGMIRTPMVCNRNPLSMVRQIADLKRL